MYADKGEGRFKIKKDGTYGGSRLSLSMVNHFTFNPKLSAAPSSDGHVPFLCFICPVSLYVNRSDCDGKSWKRLPTMDVDLIDAMADIYAYSIKKLIYW